jgi:hypothetical protein
VTNNNRPISPEIKNFVARYPADVIVFVGAGASVGFDMPLMNAFFSKYFPNFGAETFKGLSLNRPIKGDDILLHCISKMEETQISDAINTRQSQLSVDLEKLLEFMEEVKNNLIRPSDPKVLTALNLAITAKHASLNPEGNPVGFYSEDLWRDFVYEIESSYKILVRKLYEVYGRKPDASLGVDVKNTYDPLFNTIADKVRGSIAVFTTNYDLVLDLYLKNNYRKYDRLYTHGFAPSGSDGRKRWGLENYLKKTDAPVISYFNLHGSVLWERNGLDWIYNEPEEGVPNISSDEQVALEAPVIGKGTLPICQSMYDFYNAVLMASDKKPRYFFAVGYSFRDELLADLTAAHIVNNPDMKFIHISPTNDYVKVTGNAHNERPQRIFWVNEKFGKTPVLKLDKMMDELGVWL